MLSLIKYGDSSTARIKRLGIRSLQFDDYLIVFAVFCYTVLCIALNSVISGSGSNLMSEEDIRNLTPTIHAERVKGSKWVFVSEHFMVLTIWTLKTVMLLIYARITYVRSECSQKLVTLTVIDSNGLWQRRLVNYCAIYVAIGFAVSELSLFLLCRPLSNYWAVPTPNCKLCVRSLHVGQRQLTPRIDQCSSYQYYEIIQGVFAISADIFMLLIAIPLLMAVRLPPRQKITLVFLFGLGIFVIVAAILTKVYCLVPQLISYVYMSWYFREATVAMLVTCLPLTWSLMRDIFPALKSWTGGSRPTRPTPHTFSRRTGSRFMSMNLKEYQLQSSTRFKSTTNDERDDFGHEIMITRGGSTESRTASRGTNQTGERSSPPQSREGDTEPLQGNIIRQDVTITVQTEQGRDNSGRDSSGSDLSHARLQQQSRRSKHTSSGSERTIAQPNSTPWESESTAGPHFDQEQQRHYP